MTVLAAAQPITVEHLVAPGALARKAMARVGESVAKFLKRNRWRFDLDTILVINGKPVLRRDDGWKLRRFEPGDVVRFVSRPFGGGNQGKQIGGLIALIALTVFATWAVGPAGLGLTGLAAAGTKAVIVAGGMLLYNTLVYPKPGNRSDEDGLFSFNAAGNTARPLETIPLAYGRLQRDLDYAALPYKTYDGTDEYFNGLFMIGCGRYDHEALLVEDVEMWRADAPLRPGEPAGSGSASTIPGFTTVWTNSSTGTRPSSPGVLDPFEDVQIEFVEPGQPVTLFPTNVHQSPEVNGLEFGNPSDAGGGWSAWFPVCNPNDVTSLIHLDIALPNGFSRNDHATEAAYTVEIRPINVAGAPIGPAVSTTRLYSGLHRKPHRFTHSFPQSTAARYALRFRRNAKPEAGKDNTDFYAAGLRAEIPGETVFPEGTMLAVRIKATKQLSDYSSRRIRYRGTRKLPVWTGSAWVEEATRNPIWAAIDFRTHPDYGGRMPLNRLQLDEWIEEAAAAAARGDTFDYEFKNAVKVGEGVDTILAAARCKHRWYGHIFTLVRDEWRTTPRMLITDREMVAGSFSLTANFRDANAPDGLIVNYIDEETWRPAQVTVPIGSSPVNPITEELRGVTKRAHATREAIFKWNAQTKRRIGPSFTMLLDGHLLGYGDHVEIQSRTPQAWGAPHPVVGLSGNTVRLPRAPDWGDGTTLYGAIRMKDGGLFGPCIVTQGSTPRHVVFNASGLAAILAATGKTLADALDRAADAAPPTLVLGKAFDFLKRMQVVSVEPRGDKAQVSGFLDYAEVHAGSSVEAPRPPAITFPAKEMPRVVSLDARLRQALFETRIEASWPAAPPATRYVLEVQYEEASRPIPVWSGAETSCDVVVDNYALQARVVPYGDRGAGYPSPWVNLAPVEVRLPDGSVGQAALDASLQASVAKIDLIEQEARDLAKSISPNADIRATVKGKFDTSLRDLVRDIGLSLGYVLTQFDRQADTMRDAGITVDPASGTVRIEAVDRLRTSTDTRFNQVTALFDSVNALIALRATKAELDNAVASVLNGFAPAYRWEFNGTAEGWTGSNATITTSTGSITAAGTAAGAYIQSPAISFDAAANKVVELRVRRTAGSGWGLSLQYGGSYANSTAIAQPAVPTDWNVLRLDLSGQTGWTGTLTGLRLAVANGSTFEIDYVTIGNSTAQDLIIGGLSARVSDLELNLNAAQSAILLRATLVDLNAATGRLTTAENRLDAAEAAITNRVTTATFDPVATRVTTAEARIDALQGQITLSIGAVQDKSPLIRDLALADAKGQIDAFLRGKVTEEKLAYASQTLGAKVEDNGTSIATLNTNLIALSGSTDSRFAQEIAARADGDAALTSRAAALEAAVNNPSTGLAAATARIGAEEAARAAADGALTTSLATQTSRIDGAVADIANLAATKADASGVAAIAQQTLDAAFGAGSANVKMRLAALGTPSGYDALFEITASVNGAAGTYKSTGLLLAVLTVGGVQVSRIQFKADQTQFLGNDGTPFIVFDSATRTLLAERIKSGTGGRYLYYNRTSGALSMGTGNANPNSANSWNTASMGTLNIGANENAINGASAGQGFVDANMRFVVTYGGVTVSGNAGGSLSFQVAIIARRMGFSDVFITDPPYTIQVGSGIGTNGFFQVIANSVLFPDTGVALLAAGDWEILLGTRAIISGDYTYIPSNQSVTVTGRAMIRAPRI